jgi:hypothetical protein
MKATTRDDLAEGLQILVDHEGFDGLAEWLMNNLLSCDNCINQKRTKCGDTYCKISGEGTYGGACPDWTCP